MFSEIVKIRYFSPLLWHDPGKSNIMQFITLYRGVVFILRKIMSLCGTLELNILLPECIPSVRFNKAAQMQNTLPAISIPPHTATTQTCFYNTFASCFNGAATNRQVAGKEISVVHFILITHKISYLYRQFFLTTFRQISRIIGHRTQNRFCSVAVLKKLLAIFIVPDVARIVTFAKQRFAGFREMFGCMIKIYQFFVVIVYRSLFCIRPERTLAVAQKDLRCVIWKFFLGCKYFLFKLLFKGCRSILGHSCNITRLQSLRPFFFSGGQCITGIAPTMAFLYAVFSLEDALRLGRCAGRPCWMPCSRKRTLTPSMLTTKTSVFCGIC